VVSAGFVCNGRATRVCSRGVLVRPTQEVRQGDDQCRHAGQQAPGADEARPVDSAPQETHKRDEHHVPHLRAPGIRPQPPHHSTASPVQPATCDPKPSGAPATHLVEGHQDAHLLAGEPVASLDGGDGALETSREHELCQLQETVTDDKDLEVQTDKGREG